MKTPVNVGQTRYSAQQARVTILSHQPPSTYHCAVDTMLLEEEILPEWLPLVNLCPEDRRWSFSITDKTIAFQFAQWLQQPQESFMVSSADGSLLDFDVAERAADGSLYIDIQRQEDPGNTEDPGWDYYPDEAYTWCLPTATRMMIADALQLWSTGQYENTVLSLHHIVHELTEDSQLLATPTTATELSQQLYGPRTGDSPDKTA